MDLSSWTLGLSLIVLTIAINTTGVVLLAFGLERRIRVGADRHLDDPRRAIPAVIGHIGTVALILAALHGTGSTLWASAYRWLGAFGSFTDASLYSLGTMTTFEVPGLVLSSRWRMLGALGQPDAAGPNQYRHHQDNGKTNHRPAIPKVPVPSACALLRDPLLQSFMAP